MPIYEYECQSCGRRSEVMQKMSDPPLDTCTVCSGALKKLLSAPAFQFKGSGWYVTDYARKGGEKGDKGEKAEKSDKGDRADKGEKSDRSDKGEAAKPATESSSSKSDGARDPKPAKEGGGTSSGKSPAAGAD